MSAFARFRRALAFALLVVGGVVVAAESECVEYKLTGDFGDVVQGSDKSSVCNSWAAADLASFSASVDPGGSHTFAAVDIHLTGGSAQTGCGYTRNRDGLGYSAASKAFVEVAVECPSDPCSALAGLPTAQGGAGARPESGYACARDDGEGGSGNICEIKLQGASMSTGSGWFGQAKFTGVTGSCGGDEPASSTAANCVSGAGGQVCVSKKKQDCGIVNGEAVCLDKVPAGNCLLLSGGGAVCDSEAGVPPAPSDSEGMPAVPSQQVERIDSDGESTTYNYYSSSVVNSSSTTVSGLDNGSSGGGGGSGSGGDGGDGEACEADADCFGAAPSDECGDNLVSCIGDAAAGAYEEFGATPLFAAVAGLYAAVPNSGTCPSVPVDVFEQTTDAMASFCTVMADSGGDELLGLFFAICWSFAGLRILVGGGD